MSHGISSMLKHVVIWAMLSLSVPPGLMSADNQGVNPLPPPPPAATTQTGLDPRLQTIKKDLEIFLAFAEHFVNRGETVPATQLQGPLDNYLARHADYLVAQGAESPAIETIQLSAEIMLIKTRLFIALNFSADAGTALADLKRLFAPYQKISVQILGKTTTLDEAVRQLDIDLSRTAAARK